MKDKNGKTLTFSQVVAKVLRRIISIVLEFVCLFLRLVGLVPLHSLRLFFYRLFGIKIGRGSTIHMFASFYDPRNIVIGDDTIVGEGAVLDGRRKLVIGHHVAIASGVMIYNAEHDINSPFFQTAFGEVIIEDYVFIGPRAIILPGVKIAKGAVVAAGAVVVKDVGENEIAGGVPAKTIGIRKTKDFNYRIGRAAWFR